MTARIEVHPATATEIPTLVPLVEHSWRFKAIEGFDAAQVAALLQRVITDPSLGRAWLASVDAMPAGYLLAAAAARSFNRGHGYEDRVGFELVEKSLGAG